MSLSMVIVYSLLTSLLSVGRDLFSLLGTDVKLMGLSSKDDLLLRLCKAEEVSTTALLWIKLLTVSNYSFKWELSFSFY